MKNKILLGAGLTACLAAWGAKDPIVMTVNGVDVPLSEFEYLFRKNSKQQLAPQTIDEYIGMFEIYKLKVAAAKEAGLDTTKKFIDEMAQYRHELALPYLTDSLLIRSFAEEYAQRMKEEVEASHIMLFKTRSADENRKLRARLDSIRKEILNGADFSEMALKFSNDPSVRANKGNLGFIPAGRYPYSFETAVWTLPEGQLSEIVESSAGYHLIKSGSRRKSRGKVEVSHIMTMVRPDASPETQEEAKSLIDSLYNVVTANPEKFAEVAGKYSADPGSARKGGLLPVFGTGEMVPEFEEVSFALSPGEISKPVRSQYGWHIIKKHKNLPGPDVDEAEDIIKRHVSNPQDERARMMRDAQTRRLAMRHKGKLNDKVLDNLVTTGKINGLDSAFFASYSPKGGENLTLFTIGGKKFSAGEFLDGMKGAEGVPAEMAETVLRNGVDVFFNSKLVEAEEDRLYATNIDYRNLLNEYHDGTLLYEISVDKVWDKASSDTEGLEKYFEAHRDDYHWHTPRVKGYLVQAVNDSVGALAKETLINLPADQYMDALKKDFKGVAVIEKVLSPKGQNPIVDELFYGVETGKGNNGKFKTAFLLDAKELSAPETVEDVRPSVVSDYQNELEKEWVEQLRSTYPVKINRKQLKKVKP